MSSLNPLLCTDTTPSFSNSQIKHEEIIESLLSKIKVVDFQLLVFPSLYVIKKEMLDLESKMFKSGNSLNTDEQKTLLARIKEIKDELKRMRPNNKDLITLTIQQILILARENNWGLCRNDVFIYLYNGAYWGLFSKDQIITFLSKAAQKMGVKKLDAQHYKFADELLKQFQFSAILPNVSTQQNATLINLKNRTFHITPETRMLRSFDDQDFIKYQLPFEYDPTAQAPIFMSFLNKVLPDLERQNILAEYLGYIFIQPSVFKPEKTLFLYGTGANGKSVLYEIVKALLGAENISNYSIQSLTDSTGYFRANLANKLVNYASEINGKMETSYFKQLVSGEDIEARLPYCPPFILKNYAKMIFNGNTLPKEVEHTNAYFRRFLIIPFDVTIPEEEQDRDLPQKIIQSELAGVFNWVLVGLERLLNQRKFSKCDAAERTVKEYKKDSDTVQLFLEDENYKPDLQNPIPLKDLHSIYKSYCLDNGYKPVSNRTLAERLRGLDIRLEKKNIGKMVYISNTN